MDGLVKVAAGAVVAVAAVVALGVGALDHVKTLAGDFLGEAQNTAVQSAESLTQQGAGLAAAMATLGMGTVQDTTSGQLSRALQFCLDNTLLTTEEVNPVRPGMTASGESAAGQGGRSSSGSTDLESSLRALGGEVKRSAQNSACDLVLSTARATAPKG